MTTDDINKELISAKRRMGRFVRTGISSAWFGWGPSCLRSSSDSTVRRRLKKSIDVEKPFFEGVPVIGCKYRNRRINCATSFNVDKEFDTIICSSLSFMMAQKKASIWFDCSQAVDITVFFRIADSDVFLLFLYKTRSRQPARDQGEVLSKNNPSLLCSAC